MQCLHMTVKGWSHLDIISMQPLVSMLVENTTRTIHSVGVALSTTWLVRTKETDLASTPLFTACTSKLTLFSRSEQNANDYTRKMKSGMAHCYSIWPSWWSLARVHFVRLGGIVDSKTIGVMTPIASFNDFAILVQKHSTAATT